MVKGRIEHMVKVSVALLRHTHGKGWHRSYTEYTLCYKVE